MHISYQEALETPWEEIERAHYIWELRHDKLEADKKRKT